MFRRLYFDKQTGNVILNYSFNSGSYAIPTIEQDFASYIDLNNKNIETVGYKDFHNGEYEQDFMQCNGCRVNPETLQMEFSYPDPNEPTQETIYQKPFSEKIKELEARQTDTEIALANLMGM